MPKLRFAVLVIVTGFSTAAFAQALTSEMRSACKADFEKYCAGTTPGGGRIIACLNKQRDQLGEACKKVLDAQKK
jgi:Cysteine rich repeat